MKYVAAILVLAAGLCIGLSSGASAPPCWAKQGTCTTTGTTTTSPPPGVYPVPSSVDDTCTTDVAQVLLSWFATVPDGSTLQFGTSKCYRVESVLEFSGRNSLVFDGNGSTFRSVNPVDDQRAMWRAVASSNLVFKNMRLSGSYCCGGTHDVNLQHAHGIDLRGTSAEVASVTGEDLAGDGVYYGLGYDGVTASSGSVHDSVFQWLGRNGVSLVAAHDVRVERTRVHLAGFDSFDVEPNVNSGPGVQRAVFDSNTITGGYRLYAFGVVMNRPISDVSFTNNQGTGNSLRSGVINPGNQSYRPQNLTFSGNTSDTSGPSPVIEVRNTDGLTVTNNTLPTSGYILSCVSVTGLVFSANIPQTSTGC